MEADYRYDVYGNRIEKAVDADGAGGGGNDTTRFAYDGWKPGDGFIGNENFDIWADLDGDNSNALETRYLRGDVIDQLFARIESDGTPYWLLTDRLGSIRDVMNNSGTVKDTLVYDGFGNITSESDSAFRGRYAWTGRELDVETELQYNRARYYDSGMGRWISQDPLGFDAGDSNLYRYVSNEPMNGADPSGLDRYITPFSTRRHGRLHQGIAVDKWVQDPNTLIWRRDGIVTFDFLPSLNFGKQPIASALNFLNCSVASGQGRIQVSQGLNLHTSKPIRFRSTPAQDRELIRLVNKDIKNPPRFSAAFQNCTYWAGRAIEYGKNTKGEPSSVLKHPFTRNALNAFHDELKRIGLFNNARLADIQNYGKGLILVPPLDDNPNDFLITTTLPVNAAIDWEDVYRQVGWQWPVQGPFPPLY